MSIQCLSRRLLLTAAFVLAPLTLAACDREGPAERAGEAVDESAEKAADRLEDAADEAEDALDEARPQPERRP